MPLAIANLRYSHFESRRQAKLKLAKAARNQLLTAATGSDKAPITATRGGTKGEAATPVVGQTPRTPGQRAASAGGPRSVTPQTRGALVLVPRENTRVQETILEGNRRRAEAYNRAQQLAAVRELEVVRRQQEQAARCRNHLEALQSERELGQEVKRLRLVDVKDHVQQLRRIEQYRTQVKAQEWDRKVTNRVVDRTSVLAARSDYLTPRQREEKRRSASAAR